jgi:NADH-quinone oxidoreductase subunit F
VSDAQFRLLTGSADQPLISFEEYRRSGGYTALQKALSSLQPENVRDEIEASRLRGRGGAGVLTAEKLKLAARSDEAVKYVVCNAYDADPRSRISETLLARNPHVIIEGLALAAYAIGAREGFLYMRGGNPQLAETVKHALQEAKSHGAIGNNMFGSSFDFAVTQVGVEIGFMGGEESTLLQVLGGRPAKAQQRPPYPTEYGLQNKPTIVLNSETVANLPVIVARGGDTFSGSSNGTSSGTKLFTILGPATGERNGTVVEVPFGATVADALQAAGVTVSETTARGFSIGGMEGGAFPLSGLNTVLDFETIEQAGSILGSSIIEVIPTGTCMVRWAMDRMDYLSRASCGKCVPCRVGVKRMAGTLQGIVSDIGKESDLALLEEFSHYVPDGSLCGFGVSAVHPVTTTMKFFADEYTAHLEGRCPTGTCQPVRTHRYATKHVL